MGIGLVLVSALGYGFLPILVKLAYGAGISPRELLIWRFLVATILMWAIWPLWRQPTQSLRSLPQSQLNTAIGLGVLFAVVALFTFYTIAAIPAATYTVLLHTYPALVAVITLLLGERIPRLEWIAVALAFIGSLLVVGAQFAIYRPLDLLLPFGMSLSYAVYLYLSEKLASDISGMAFGAISMTATTIGLLFLIPFGGLSFQLSGRLWVYLGLIATLSTVIPLIAMFIGTVRLGASTAAIISTVEPVVTIVLAVVFLREEVTFLQYFGATIVIISVVMLSVNSLGYRPPPQ